MEETQRKTEPLLVLPEDEKKELLEDFIEAVEDYIFFSDGKPSEQSGESTYDILLRRFADVLHRWLII